MENPCSSSISSLDKRRKIVHEVEWVLDLVRDAGGQLAERGEFLGLDEAVLRGAQVVERPRQLVGPRLHFIEQADILDRDAGLVGEGFDQLDLPRREIAHLGAREREHTDRRAFAQDRDAAESSGNRRASETA